MPQFDEVIDAFINQQEETLYIEDINEYDKFVDRQEKLKQG